MESLMLKHTRTYFGVIIIKRYYFSSTDYTQCFTIITLGRPFVAIFQMRTLRL